MISAADILRGKILVVDDQEANVLLLEQMLCNAGYTSVSSTMDPEKVCELHLRNAYDLILLDLQMPGMDGFQVMENLKEIEAGGYLPVLVITAQPDHKLRALRSGARDFVSKPFDLAEVLLRVHNLLEVRLLHMETKLLYERILAEQKVSERLMLNVLPITMAGRRKGAPPTVHGDSPKLISDGYAEISLLFEDIAEFTRYSEGASAEVLMGVLDDLSSRLEGGPQEPGSTRKRVMGDAHLASVGLPRALVDPTILAAGMAVELIETVDRFNNGHPAYQLRVRIGLSHGTKPAGSAGKTRIHYDL